MKLLDFNEKVAMLWAYCKRVQLLEIWGEEFLLFRDYSTEVVKERSAFIQICSMQVFSTPEEAEEDLE